MGKAQMSKQSLAGSLDRVRNSSIKLLGTAELDPSTGVVSGPGNSSYLRGLPRGGGHGTTGESRI